MRLALYQPDIAQNVGTILRLAACLGVPVHVIGPAGFDISDRALRRAGMDYIAHAAILGGALASTDPVLLRTLLRHRRLPETTRIALRMESGMNDGYQRLDDLLTTLLAETS